MAGRMQDIGYYNNSQKIYIKTHHHVNIYIYIKTHRINGFETPNGNTKVNYYIQYNRFKAHGDVKSFSGNRRTHYTQTH